MMDSDMEYIEFLVAILLRKIDYVQWLVEDEGDFHDTPSIARAIATIREIYDEYKSE